MASKRKRASDAEYKPCQHLINYRKSHGIGGFRLLQKCLTTKASGRASLSREEKEVPSCAACGRAHGRLYACLLCANIGCWVTPDLCHAQFHAHAKPGHDIAIDVDRGELFCCTCSDQVYDADFDRVVLCAESTALWNKFKGNEMQMTITKDGEALISNHTKGQHRKHKEIKFKPWVPSQKETILMKQKSTPLTVDSSLPLGLRGLNNLGNTCFMNCVLQALLHTPPLRNYFLSDRHNRSLCQGRAPHLCLGCDMDAIFSAAFSGDRRPYSPAQFLYSWWRHASNLAGYVQQDAHEFFISTVDGIHANSNKSSPRLAHSECQSAGNMDCHCIVHRVFSGLLRSDVTCSACGFTSTTYDPCVDISLDLETSFVDKVSMDLFNSRATSNIPTLLGCLDRFTRSEKLGCKEGIFCECCQVKQQSTKQMSFRKLPLVLCFHIKRFEHFSSRNTSRKVDRYVQFPFSLNMAPFLSSSIVKLRHGNRLIFVEHEKHEHNPFPEFELFAVITHSGKLDSGHYISYLRLGGEWYKCDDAWITRVSEEVVRSLQGYMFYYVQKKLSYRSNNHIVELEDSTESNGNYADLEYNGGSCIS